MPLTELNHYFVRANDLEQTKKFYCDVLGFEVMPRPTFPFPGYWLGVNGKIQVHMGQDGIDHADLYNLGTPKGAATDHAGVKDPNGLTIELNFVGLKNVKDWGGENYSKMPQVAGMRA